MTSADTTSVTIFHNPACSTSRNVLAMIREAGIEPRVVEYLKQPYTRDQLAALIAASGRPVREVLRRKGELYESLDLANPVWTDAQLIDQMVTHPVLVERPIVVSPLGTRLCRPAETVREVLPAPAA